MVPGTICRPAQAVVTVFTTSRPTSGVHQRPQGKNVSCSLCFQVWTAAVKEGAVTPLTWQLQPTASFFLPIPSLCPRGGHVCWHTSRSLCHCAVLRRRHLCRRRTRHHSPVLPIDGEALLAAGHAGLQRHRPVGRLAPLWFVAPLPDAALAAHHLQSQRAGLHLDTRVS